MALTGDRGLCGGYNTYAIKKAEMRAKELQGQGIDFDALGRTLAFLAAVYLVSALFQWLQSYHMAGVAQRGLARLRQKEDAKLARLPPKSFHNHPRGDGPRPSAKDPHNTPPTSLPYHHSS